MRILILSQWFDPEPTFKGLAFARKLVSQGHTVEVLTGFPNYPGGKLYPGYRVRPWRIEWLDCIRVCRVPLYPSHDRSAVCRILNYSSFALASTILGPALVYRPDVIYVYHPPGTIGLPAMVLRWWFSAPIVYDVQDLWPDTIAATGMLSSGVALALIGRFCRWVYRNADRIVVSSPGFRKTMIDLGVPEGRVELIYNWAPDQVLAPPGCTESAHTNARDEFRVVFAGTMGMAQALDAVLDAASECATTVPHARFVLVGGGVDRDRLARRAGELRLANLEFVPFQPVSAMKAIFAEADALLVHLKDDPLFAITIPSKTQAYLAAGRPVIMAVSGDAADLVERAGAGVLAKPQDPHSLAEAVRRLASSPIHERDRMGADGRAFYEKELSIEVAVDKFQRVFDSLAQLCPSGTDRSTPWMKRAMDIVGSAMALALVGPVVAVAALAIRLTMGMPPFFRQERPGLNERPFTLLKLRTMSQAVDADGSLLPDGDRLCALGRLLRKTSLDELPQFWNVFTGEMSLVGPRPLLPQYLSRYTRHQHRRHKVKPGITGWAQVHGRNALTWEQKFDLDVWYVDHWSLWLDIKILWLTVLKVWQRDGISQNGHATMQEFKGTPN